MTDAARNRTSSGHGSASSGVENVEDAAPVGDTSTSVHGGPAGKRERRARRGRQASLLERAERLLTVDSKHFGACLFAARNDAGYSLEEMVLRSGVAKGTINAIERELTRETEPAILFALSWALGYLHPGSLIAGHDPLPDTAPAPWHTPLRAFAAFWRWKGLPGVPSDAIVASMEGGARRCVVGYGGHGGHGGPGVQIGGGGGSDEPRDAEQASTAEGGYYGQRRR